MLSRRKFLKYTGWTVIVLVLLGLVARLALAPAGVAAIKHWFEQQGLEAEVTDISFDLGNGNLILSGLRADAAGEPVLRLDLARISWSWPALLDNQVRIDFIALDGLEFDIEQGPGERLVIAGIDLQKLAAQQAPVEPASAAASEPLNWTLALGDFALNDFRLCYRAPPLDEFCNQWEAFSWNGDISLDLARIDEAVLPLVLNGDLQLSRLTLENRRLERDLFGLDNLSVTGIAVDSLDNISVELVAFDTLGLLERAAESEQPQISFLKSLELEAVKLTRQSHLDIAKISLLDHELVMVKRAEGGLEIQDWLESIAREESEPAPASDTDSGKTFSFAVARIVYNTSKSIQYSDLSLASPFAVNLNSIEIEIENLDSRKPEQSSHLRYSAKYADHGSIKLEGDFTPFTEKRSFDLVGRIEGLDLRDLSSFTVSAVGHQIRSGQLDADLILRAKDNILDSEIDLTLHQLNFNAVSTADQEKVDNSLGFPLNASLSLLRDGENRIVLNIPMTGDLLDPDVSPADAIRQSVSKAITTTVLTFYTPYGLVPIAGGVFDLATALKFDPVTFDKGSDDIDDADVSGLEKLISMMLEKPGVHLTLCPFTNSADRWQLFPKSASIEAGEFVPDARQLDRLTQLGEARGLAVKNYLVSKDIDPSRLILCTPEHVEVVSKAATGEGGSDTIETGIGGVEISI